MHSSHDHRHERHRVVAEDINHLYGNGVPTRSGISVEHGNEFQLSVLPSAKALPFIFKKVVAGPSIFDLDDIAA